MFILNTIFLDISSKYLNYSIIGNICITNIIYCISMVTIGLVIVYSMKRLGSKLGEGIAIGVGIWAGENGAETVFGGGNAPAQPQQGPQPQPQAQPQPQPQPQQPQPQPEVQPDPQGQLQAQAGPQGEGPVQPQPPVEG